MNFLTQAMRNYLCSIRNNPVQPHTTLKGIWHCFFEIGFWEPRVLKQEAFEISFVNTPADTRWEDAPR